MTILICDDHKIVRDGLKQILGHSQPGMVITEAGSGKELMNLCEKEVFNIILLDISLPDKNGLEILQAVKNRWPATNVLMLSMHPQEQYARRSLALGASGYLTKDTASEELIVAIKRIADGQKYISQSLAENLALHISKEENKQEHEILSGREFDIMIKLATGKSLVEIAKDLFISNKTVSTYRSRIMEKMNCSKNTELTKYCIEKNLI